MDLLKHDIYFLLFQIILKISMAACNSTVTADISTVTEDLFTALFLRNRRQHAKGQIHKKSLNLQSTTKKVLKRTVPVRETFDDECEYLSHYCLKTYTTGRICARTIFFQYQSFENYCMMDYMNCRLRYEVWQLMHMGHCYKMKVVTHVTGDYGYDHLSDWQTYGAEHSTLYNPIHKALRRNMSDSIVNEQPKMIRPQYIGGSFVEGGFGQMPGEGSGKLARRQMPPRRPIAAIYGKKETTQLFKRTTPRFISRPDYCDYIAKPCLHSYVTGKICARSLNYFYETFDSYCMMEYVNCRENYEIWQMVYTGACFNATVITDYIHYPYHDDFFMDMYYVVDDRIV